MFAFVIQHRKHNVFTIQITLNSVLRRKRNSAAEWSFTFAVNISILFTEYTAIYTNLILEDQFQCSML